jgi:hypothetical protein
MSRPGRFTPTKMSRHPSYRKPGGLQGRSVAAQAWFRSRVSPSGRFGGQSGTGIGFCPARCCSVRIISLELLILHHNTAFTRRTSGRSLGTFEQSSVLSNVREQWTQECLHIVCFFFYFCVLRKPKRIHRSSSHYHLFSTFPFCAKRSGNRFIALLLPA